MQKIIDNKNLVTSSSNNKITSRKHILLLLLFPPLIMLLTYYLSFGQVNWEESANNPYGGLAAGWALLSAFGFGSIALVASLVLIFNSEDIGFLSKTIHSLIFIGLSILWYSLYFWLI